MALMAEDGDQDVEVGFEEGKTWLPSQVLDEAFFDTTKKKVSQQQHRHQRPKLPPQPLPLRPRGQNRAKHSANWGSRGSGMQAIFLDSGQRSCGTGVFLPQTVGTNIQLPRKPACSPILLPSRVVQALNLNVHAIGSQASSHQEKGENWNKSTKNKRGSDLSAAKCGAASQNQNSSSPEIFLPKEWTY